MKNNQFMRFSQWTLLVVCLLLLTAGCSKPQEGWDFGLLSEEHQARQRSSGEVLVLFSKLSTRFDTLLENLEGPDSDKQTQQLIQRLSETTMINLTVGDLVAIQYNQQRIKTLSETATTRTADLTALLKKLNQDKVILSAKQIILLDRLLEEYAKDIESLLAEVEISKADQMDGLDLDTLDGFSAGKFITMQELEIEALSTLNDYLKQVIRRLD